MRDLTGALRVAAAASMAGGIVMATLPPDRSVSGVPLEFNALAPAAGAAADGDSLAVEIIVANVFSADRSPPSSRYVPPGTADSTAALVDAAVPDESMPGSGFEPLLFGTMVRGAGSVALLQLTPHGPGPRLYRAGDRDGAWRIVSIAPREVVLTGPAGRHVLTLPSEEIRP